MADYNRPDINSPEGRRDRYMRATLPDANESTRRWNGAMRDSDNSAANGPYGRPSQNHNEASEPQYRGGGRDSR